MNQSSVDCITYFLKIPKNIRSFEVSSGGFSGVLLVSFTDDDSDEVEGAVEADDSSNEPDDADAMIRICTTIEKKSCVAVVEQILDCPSLSGSVVLPRTYFWTSNWWFSQAPSDVLPCYAIRRDNTWIGATLVD